MRLPYPLGTTFPMRGRLYQMGQAAGYLLQILRRVASAPTRTRREPKVIRYASIMVA